MKREIACRLDGVDVMQTTTVHDDKGELHSESVSRLGDRDVVLGQIQEQVDEAQRDRDGITSPKATKPAPAGDGAPGESVAFFLSGQIVYKTTTNRNAAGKVVNERTEQLGAWKGRMENAEERLKELTTLRDAIKGAK